MSRKGNAYGTVHIDNTGEERFRALKPCRFILLLVLITGSIREKLSFPDCQDTSKFTCDF